MPRRWRTVQPTTAGRARAPSTAAPITPRSCSTSTATTSRPCSTRLRPRSRSALLREQLPVRRDPDALLVEALADEELERRPGSALRVEHPVDLPFGQERVVRSPRLGPVGELRQASERPGELGALLDRPLEPLLPHRHVEARLAQRVRERAERVPVERLRGQPALVVVDVAGGRRASQL